MTNTLRAWSARTAGSPAVRVALAVNAAIAFLGVRLDAQVEGAQFSTALGFLSSMCWVWGMVLAGLPLAGDMRSGYASLVFVREGQLHRYAAGATVAGGVAAVAVTTPAAMGVAVVELMAPASPSAPAALAIPASLLGMAALGASAAAVAGIAGALGTSKGVAGSVAVAVLLLAEILATQRLSPRALVAFTEPNWYGATSWAVLASVLTAMLGGLTRTTRARLAL